MMCLDRDTIAPLTRRMYNIADCHPAVHVIMNNRQIKPSGFQALPKAPPELWPEERRPSQMTDLLQQLGPGDNPSTQAPSPGRV